METENPWRARSIHAELEKLGLQVCLVMVSRYLPKRASDHEQRQRWITFLRNHPHAIGAMDFLFVPTACFKLLFVWLVISHGRREVLHVNVTDHPTAAWVVQQLRETFASDTSVQYLIHENETIYSNRVGESISSFGIETNRTAFSPPGRTDLLNVGPAL